MKRFIKPFAVEVRRGRKGSTPWPAVPELASAAPTHGRSTPTPLDAGQQEAAPAWAGARILPAIEPADRSAPALTEFTGNQVKTAQSRRPRAKTALLQTESLAKQADPRDAQHQDEAPEPREREADVPLKRREREAKPASEPRECRTEPAQERVEDREQAAPKAWQRREKPAQTPDRAADQQQRGGASAVLGAKIIARTRKSVLAADVGEAGEPERSAFRRGARWRARLPAVVASKHIRRQRKSGSKAGG